MSVFAAALAALYRVHPEAVAATYSPQIGSPVACTVIRAVDSVDDAGRFSSGGTVQDRDVLKVQLAQVPTPALGDSFTIGSTVLLVNEEPQLDVEGLEWTFGVIEDA
jgi:hypothetical protein